MKTKKKTHSISRQSKEFARELDICLDDEDELQINDIKNVGDM